MSFFGIYLIFLQLAKTFRMKLKTIVLMLVAGLLLAGCNYNASIMLRTDDDYPYDSIPKDATVEYKIAPNDVLDFSLYSNDGFKLIDLTTISPGTNNANVSLRTKMAYLVEHDGHVKLPILGRIKLSGLTLREAELLLEEKYSADYVKPFVLLDISNRRVIVFPGADGAARVIPLGNNNTTLLEGLALAGGISENGKARKIKLIRGSIEAKKREVYLIDLSTMDGLQYVDMVLQANDIIYVEPKMGIARELVRDISTALGLLSSSFIIYRLTTGTF